MDLKDKIVNALRDQFKVDYVRLEDDGGISGFVVSPQFKGVSTLDRQGRIDEALSKAADPLSPDERRRVVMIAGLTPAEYEAVGARVRVHRVREITNGTVEVLLHGTLVDAEYVRGGTPEPERRPDDAAQAKGRRAGGVDVLSGQRVGSGTANEGEGCSRPQAGPLHRGRGEPVNCREAGICSMS